MLACLRNKGAFCWPNSDQWWSLGQHGLSTTYKKTLSKAQVTESWVGCSWQSIYLNKIQTSCNKLILESHKKVLFIVRLTVSGGFSGWTSTPSALTINKSEILTHFSTEIWFFDTQNTYHLFFEGSQKCIFHVLFVMRSKKLGGGPPPSPLLPIPKLTQYTVCEKWTKEIGGVFPPLIWTKSNRTAIFFRETFP